MKVRKLTGTGKATDAAISPDGKYVVYVEDDAGKQSLWIRQVATESNVQIVPPAKAEYYGLTFSNDGDYVYYVRLEESNPIFTLYRVPSIGAASKKLIENIDSCVAFSPDGQRIAFVRASSSMTESRLMIANADGTAEQTIATRKSPDLFLASGVVRIAWSPDGKIVACPAARIDANNNHFSLVGVSVEDGTETLLSSQRWSFVSHAAWLSDGSGLVILAVEEGASGQLWGLSYPGGQARRITNDPSGYAGLSLARDSDALVTVQSDVVSSVWVAPGLDTNRPRQITSGRTDGSFGLTWTPDGRIVYGSMASGQRQIWIMDADGSNQKQLTYEGSNSRPRVSGDGRYIVFVSYRAGRFNIFRMDTDGENPKQLTDGTANFMPDVSPDGRWVFYVSTEAGPRLGKVPLDGGNPVQLADTQTSLPVVSPDGKQLAGVYYDDQVNPASGVAILPLEGGQPTKRFKISINDKAIVLRWSSDGRALLYNDLSNIWSQPVDGGKPSRLTDFQGDQLFRFDYSRDGRWLALARGKFMNDVVLIRDFR
jgi:Tol biopolymer transport system component